MQERSLIFSVFNEACKKVASWSPEKVKEEFDKREISFKAYHPKLKLTITLSIEDYEDEKKCVRKSSQCVKESRACQNAKKH